MRYFRRFRAHHCRCRHCQTRKKLRRHPDNYLMQPACPVCARRDWRVDNWMMRRDTRAMACRCGGYWFQHRQGSLACHYNANGTEREFELEPMAA
ncbi:hypothetical protein [Jeongeupia sp. USM3]|uniref:hypothetical protein n=1 Tax=Jeongeupia sp. USM3 TaxID=1906741 RepID=UPI00089DF698|nr:hypothetical protein [Jeongeupia sp. USM3]AOY00128.1 hypothetical protein BJP62_06480 [Jeongeupia sp. USM3]